MITLHALLEIVKDEQLPLAMIEKYRDELIHLHSAMQLELAYVEKAEALYFDSHSAPDVSDISIKRKWRATEKGQRHIDLNRMIKVVVKEVDSLRSRVYRLI
jgi:hypothetical protein